MLEKLNHSLLTGLMSVSLLASTMLFLATPAQASGWQYDMWFQIYFFWSLVGFFSIFIGFLAGRTMSTKTFALMLVPISAVLVLLSFVVGSAENVINRLIFALQVVAYIDVLAAISMMAARYFGKQKAWPSDREQT